VIRIIAVGRLKDPNTRGAFEDYRKRIGRFARLEVIELKDEERIRGHLEKGGVIVALDEGGMALTSKELAEFIKEKSLSGDVTFVIGGPEGLKGDVKARADLVLSLSRFTFTSQMARLILIEQIYRALTIIKGVGYHR
jgi:23S rRNA (pseudouridine1915-N3)-methyltransferase